MVKFEIILKPFSGSFDLPESKYETQKKENVSIESPNT